MSFRKLSAFFVALCLSLFLAVNASAFSILQGWGIDLSVYGGDTYSNLLKGTVTGVSILNQTVTGGLLQNNDPFVESTVLQEITFTSLDDMTYPDGRLYFHAVNLSGYVTNVDNNNSSDPSDWDFNYVFTGADSITLYYSATSMSVNPDHFNPEGLTVVSTFSLLSGSGVAPENFIGGGENYTGSTSMTVKFETTDSDVWTTPSNVDFADLIETPGYPVLFFSITNTINDENVSSTEDGFTARIDHDGGFQTALVPEPSTILLLGAGLLGLGILGRRKMMSK